MGPQLMSCGESDLDRCSAAWIGASMGPQLMSCGEGQCGGVADMVARASMGPQLMSCGEEICATCGHCAKLASMGPQLMSCGELQDNRIQDYTTCFNGAAAHELRRVAIPGVKVLATELQWGRSS